MILFFSIVAVIIIFLLGAVVGLAVGFHDWMSLDKALMRDIQLHEELRIIYVVDGWQLEYSTDDGNTQRHFHGVTPLTAMQIYFSEIRNERGRS